MSTLLLAAAAVIFATGLAHSCLGERYILMRLFRRELPKLFGSDWFTKRTLRFAWHLTTLAWWTLATILVGLAMREELTRADLLSLIGALAAMSGVVAAAATRGRHLSWGAFFAVATLCWLANA